MDSQVVQQAGLPGWPLPVLDVGRVDASAARDAILGLLDRALARDEPFAAVVDMSAITLDAPGGRDAKVAGQAKAVKELRARLAAHCKGLAFVVPAVPPGAETRSANDRFWGCPTATVEQRPEALEWAQEQLAA